MRTLTTVVDRVVVRRVDSISLRVHRRIAELGWPNMIPLSEAMGVTQPRIRAILKAPIIEAGTFARLSAALGMSPEDWTTPLPPPPRSLRASHRARVERIRKAAQRSSQRRDR